MLKSFTFHYQAYANGAWRECATYIEEPRLYVLALKQAGYQLFAASCFSTASVGQCY